MRIRTGDQVVVIRGDYASTDPRPVLQVLDGGKRLVVQGVNVVYKHVRRGHPRSPQGGRLEVELPIDASNVLLFCDACGRGVRIGYRFDDNNQKERFCRRCGKGLGKIGRPRRRQAAH